ncbi:hypothetical protein BC830DRAFT_195125 [Chytriomyces sp. MP71]|nr:hypothetical protein BC830DRAFT_195125 [Chytriomyces sp. MP71]
MKRGRKGRGWRRRRQRAPLFPRRALTLARVSAPLLPPFPLPLALSVHTDTAKPCVLALPLPLLLAPLAFPSALSFPLPATATALHFASFSLNTRTPCTELHHGDQSMTSATRRRRCTTRCWRRSSWLGMTRFRRQGLLAHGSHNLLSVGAPQRGIHRSFHPSPLRGCPSSLAVTLWPPSSARHLSSTV